MRLDYLFNKIEKRQDALRGLMFKLVGDNHRYGMIEPYYEEINKRIIVDCVTEYIDDEVKKE